MNHKPRKRFGQNFLHDYNIISQILASIMATPDQHWVEIGPGLGALTEPLLKKGISLDVIELDRDLVDFLKQKFKDYRNLHIHSCDALDFNFAELSEKGEGLHIIGNLPYNISTPLLFHLLESAARIEDMHFMLQKEVVERMCAGPGSKKYGRLSIMIQYLCEAELLFYVPPESFNPAPKVMSAIVKLMPYRELPVEVNSLADFNKLVTQAFSQRRKTLRNSLKNFFSEQEIIDSGIDPTLRAESISLREYVRLSNQYSEKQNDLS